MRKKKKLYAHILTENINTWMDHLGQLQVSCIHYIKSSDAWITGLHTEPS